MPLDCLDVLFPSETSVSVHDESYMLGNWSLLDGTDEQLPELADSPRNRGRICDPAGDSMLVKGGHCGRSLRVGDF